MFGKLPLAVIHYPSGTWGFVGTVPADLAYETSDPKFIEDARKFGPGIVRKAAERQGGFFRTMTWPTKEAALKAAEDAGYKAEG